MACNKTEAKAALTKAFQQVDTDNSGTIESGELEKVLTNFYSSSGKKVDKAKIQDEVKKFIEELDVNKDNKINLDEFLNYFLQFCS